MLEDIHRRAQSAGRFARVRPARSAKPATGMDHRAVRAKQHHDRRRIDRRTFRHIDHDAPPTRGMRNDGAMTGFVMRPS